MTKITVDTKDAGCIKPGCKHRWTMCHRHHVRNEWFFVRRWSLQHKLMRQEKYAEFVRRYWRFLKQDTRRLCAWHHAEVHTEYDKIITKHILRNKTDPMFWTWEQANELMDALKKYFFQWVKKTTPGIEPDLRLGGLDFD